MAVRLQIRNDVATAWYQANPILAIGELAIERDTRQFKIGDGSTRWQELPYVTQGQTGKSIEFDWDDTKLGIRAEGAAEFVYVELEGKKGEQGDSLEFTWNGTKLGVRVKGTIEYIYTDLEANIRSEFQSNEALRQSNYLSSEADRNTAYLDAEDVRDAEFQSKEVIRNFFEDYDPTHSYQNGNKVAYNGSTYTAIAPSKNVEPGTNSLIWKLSAKKGDTGDVWRPTVDASGYISWAKNSSSTAPATQNIKGDKGDSITVTSETKDANGNTVVNFSDSSSVTVSKGDKGNVGDVWKPSVTAGGDLSWAKDSGATAPTQRNIKGEKGDTGDTWKPSVSESGYLTWAKDSSGTTPTARDIKGPKGDTGDIANLTATHIANALGFTPIEYTAGTNVSISGTTISATDTKTTINGKTGAIAKADIVALGIPAQDTVYNDTALVTAVGVKLAKTGDTLNDYVETLVTVSASGGAINLSLGNTFVHTPSVDPTYAISNTKAGAHSFTLIIHMGATLRVLTFPASVKWAGGDVPDMSEINTTYVLTFLTVDSGSTWLGMFGGEF